jgi:hypothetical protein
VAKSFTSENDLQTFEGWLDYQGIDHSTLTAAELEMWRETYADVRRCADATPKVGKMKLKHGEHRYAVAVREGSDLWLTTWIRRSPKGDVYVLTPRGDRGWNPHASYHRDGTFHMKSHGQKFGAAQKRQPLTGAPRSRAQSTSARTWVTDQKALARFATRPTSLASLSLSRGCWGRVTDKSWWTS